MEGKEALEMLEEVSMEMMRKLDRQSKRNVMEAVSVLEEIVSNYKPPDEEKKKDENQAKQVEGLVKDEDKIEVVETTIPQNADNGNAQKTEEAV